MSAHEVDLSNIAAATLIRRSEDTHAMIDGDTGTLLVVHTAPARGHHHGHDLARRPVHRRRICPTLHILLAFIGADIAGMRRQDAGLQRLN
ncbi:hypothetical protein [Glacieibacterium frigidum]|uniref:Uncharacterized protein n=1 Tax=Glacieibacterium frigidum TaxID=2593303 RepID=A0A552U991_9SPHN|nr:hypothetical protein [Glacieibacterium frigidum]TRW14783.1 hypothetical protein FMM06_13970 [Glacieibacterium frigidum]